MPALVILVVLAGAVTGAGARGKDIKVESATGRTVGAHTLIDAAALVPYELHLPDVEAAAVSLPELSGRLEFGAADILGGSIPGPRDRAIIRLYFGSYPGPNLKLYQSPSTFSLGGPTEPIVVQGVDGLIQRAEDFPTRFTTIHWTNGGMTYQALSILDDSWTLSDLLAVLETIG